MLFSFHYDNISTVEKEDNRILVHCCCGPCATASVERLLSEGWVPVLYFSNSNIFPDSERDKRYEQLLKLAEAWKLQVIRDGNEDHEEWRKAVRGFEGEKEGGRRCDLCFAFNLKRAAAKAAELGISRWCTTLTVSRYKNSSRIFAAGEGLEGFEHFDFKKKDGYTRSIRLSQELGLYRQKYCGCEFSMQEAAR